uniref:G protein-coupled receptor n=1 Tax=Romanomermis culicivorax TaxID=13658 RepID=A0A915IVY4_ROMCU
MKKTQWAAPHLLCPNMQSNGGICCIAAYEMQSWHMFVFFTLPMIISHAISLYCAFSISKLISKQTEAKNDREWCSKIREAKFIIRFIYIEVFMPICIETPVFISIFVNRYLSPIPHEDMQLDVMDRRHKNNSREP